MDNTFSDILNIFKKLDEGTKFDFAGEKHGQKPGDQWRGTDAGTPGNKLVGAAEAVEPTDIDNEKGSWRHEGDWVKSQGKDPRGTVTHASDQAQRTTVSLADKLKARWEETKKAKGLMEFGATANAQTDPNQAKADVAQLNQTQQIFQKLGTQAGIKPGVGAGQAAKAAMSLDDNPNANPATGAGMDQTGKKVVGATGAGIVNALVNANPADANKVIQDIQQMKQKAATK